MTSETRAYLILIAATAAAVGSYGQAVEHWTLQNLFGLVGVLGAAVVNGMAKSPRDAKLSDQAADATTSSSTTATISTSQSTGDPS